MTCVCTKYQEENKFKYMFIAQNFGKLQPV